LPVYVFFVNHLVYQTTGNMLLPIVVAFTLNCLPLNVNWPAETNLSTISEKLFSQDKRFLLPLYMYTIFDFFTWLWALFMFADEGSLSMRAAQSIFS
jgi:hypothetical protein